MADLQFKVYKAILYMAGFTAGMLSIAKIAGLMMLAGIVEEKGMDWVSKQVVYSVSFMFAAFYLYKKAQNISVNKK